jgi:GAF domain-containing protein
MSRQALLQSVADVAQAIFVARAASIAVLDPGSREFRFEAVAGEGAERLLGTTFPLGQGIAGTVAQTGEPVFIDDLTNDPRFARDIAVGSGYVPTAMMVAPLLGEEDTLGVLSVLDRGRTGRSSLEELRLLGVFADQAAIALEIGERAERASALPADELARVTRLVSLVDGLQGPRRDAALRLLGALEDLVADEG